MNAISTLIEQDPVMFNGQAFPLWGYPRNFNFDADQPFVDPTIKQALNVANFQFNADQNNGGVIINSGSFNSATKRPTDHITKVADADGSSLIRVKLFPTDGITAGSHRTQINSYPITTYRRVLLDLMFRLDAAWNFGMLPGDGLIWQLKGVAKPGQKGNPVVAFNLYGNQLEFTVRYPQAALDATTWPCPLQWTDLEYAAFNYPTMTVTPGEFHRIQLEMFLDERPGKFNGKGFAVATYDGKPWLVHNGPTLHPDQAGPHNIGFGFYQWSGTPSGVRMLDFKRCHLYGWD